MKKSLLFIFILFIVTCIHAQQDTTSAVSNISQYNSPRENANIYVSVYPVPVRDNNFTIKTDKDVSFIKITNIIGQDIFSIRYKNPGQLNKIFLNSPRRGMYLVTIIFSDGARVVKKIMIEESD
jgi:hypothetical protein